MKFRIVLASMAAFAIACPAYAFVPVSQKEYDTFAQCFAQQVGVGELLDQNVEDWTEIYGDSLATVQDSIDAIRAFSELVNELALYMADLLDELEHPAYGLDYERAEAIFVAEFSRYDAVKSLPRDERMAFVDSDAFVIEVSDLCMKVGESIDTAVVTNLESGAVAWAD